MKKVISYACLAVLSSFLSGCENKSKPQEAQIIEKAIVDFDKSYDSYSSSPNILYKIYEEILKTDTTLSKLEESTDKLLFQKKYNLERPFKSYDMKNNAYYEDANDLLNSFSDSLLKQKYAAIIQKSLENYRSKSKNLRNIVDNHDLKVKKIKELKAILKLTKTLVYIEKYQNKAKPDKDTLFILDKELDDKIKEMQKFIQR